jgi:hypothetical protein
MPDASYYVEIGDNFIEYKNEHIKVPGIKPKNWIIKTSPGIILLTTNFDCKFIY